tara:strand:- start:3722 stop:4225 length:504 start_codon:yes stop_codon:yes gene_type:complete
MDKLIFETKITLRVISENPDVKLRTLTSLIKKETIITAKEVQGYTAHLHNEGLISTAGKGAFIVTQAGTNLLNKLTIKPTTQENNARPCEPKKKESSMKGLNSELKQSLASLREKLETKPVQEVKDFDAKIELLKEIKSLPGVEDALAKLLTDIANDLTNIQAVATK